jgi:hypothetical protein
MKRRNGDERNTRAQRTLSATFGSAPAEINALSTPLSPCFAAMMSAVVPSCKIQKESTRASQRDCEFVSAVVDDGSVVSTGGRSGQGEATDGGTSRQPPVIPTVHWQEQKTTRDIQTVKGRSAAGCRCNTWACPLCRHSRC